MCSLVQGNVSDSVANTEKCLSLSLQYDNLALETPEETGDSYKCAEVLSIIQRFPPQDLFFLLNPLTIPQKGGRKAQQFRTLTVVN